eukprot:450938_1
MSCTKLTMRWKLLFLAVLVVVTFVLQIIALCWDPSHIELQQRHHIHANLTLSCLNSIYDEIFVISSSNRHETLSITLFELEEERIVYTLWECHSSNNHYSMHLWNEFKRKVDLSNLTSEHDVAGVSIHDYARSAYETANIFFLRQTQLDILDYALRRKLKKILIFEDDILLANSQWFDMFCSVEASIPSYYTLNIGVNHHKGWQVPEQGLLIDIPHHENKSIKYFRKTSKTYGAFALAIAFEMYSILIDMFDFDKHVLVVPLDNHMSLAKQWNLVNVTQNSFNIHPNLVLPDVTTSTIRENRWQPWYILDKTTDTDLSRYSKYYDLRFAEDKNLTKLFKQKIQNSMPTFGALMARQRHCPSDRYLQKTP